jgi:hypothetical protein
MGPLVLALFAASPATAARAHELAAAQSWEELYLAFSATDPKPYSAKDRAAIASDLQKGCAALLEADAVMAYSLGDRSIVFKESAEGLLCSARAGRATDQRSAAEAALHRGLKEFPKSGAFGLELGRQLLDDKDAAGARDALAKVPRRTPEYPEAQKLLAQAKSEAQENVAARKELASVESRIEQGLPTGHGEAVPAKGSESLTYESGEGPNGMRTRGNSRFIFKYFANNRDFGQRADYEGRIVDAMNEIYDFDKGFLGLAREAPCDVVLYTRQEFAAHFSGAAAARVAGLYAMNAIRMNDAAEINGQTKAVLAHEYVHAIVGDIVHGQDGRVPHWMNEGLAEYVEWRYLGSEDPPAWVGQAMHAAAKAGHMPSLQQMDRGAPINERNPAVAYGVSAVAVRSLLRNGGVDNLLGLIRELGTGASFPAVLSQRYGKTVEGLQDDVRDELAHL